jgi:hypothetical protein
MQLTWNYDGGRKTRSAAPRLRSSRVPGPAVVPVRMTARLGAFSWQWATVRKIKSCPTVSSLCSSPRASGSPRPYPSPGHTSYCGTRLTRRTVAGHILKQPPRRWASPSSSLTRSLPSTSSRPASIPSPGPPQSRLPAASRPLHCPPRSPPAARLAPPPHPPAWPALYASSAARLALFPLALFSARLGFLTICFRFHGSIVGIR